MLQCQLSCKNSDDFVAFVDTGALESVFKNFVTAIVAEDFFGFLTIIFGFRSIDILKVQLAEKMKMRIWNERKKHIQDHI